MIFICALYCALMITIFSTLRRQWEVSVQILKTTHAEMLQRTVDCRPQQERCLFSADPSFVGDVNSLKKEANDFRLFTWKP
ncbi:MAG: hypothetical protein C0456_00440 [Hyphomonas sp.]|nr:hypothetical protein [Hyphomonas sp.]